MNFRYDSNIISVAIFDLYTIVVSLLFLHTFNFVVQPASSQARIILMYAELPKFIRESVFDFM